MSNTSPTPWRFTPLLYFMQAIPVTLVQEVSSIIFKGLGVENKDIAFWASLIALPWTLQMLLGPFVDLNGTKRRWILVGQAAIAIGIILTALALQLPNFFGITLGVLALTAVFSAMTNIATDGFYLLALDRESQAKFVGLNSTFYRLGRLFCSGALVTIAGTMMNVPPVTLSVQAPYQLVLMNDKGDSVLRPSAELYVFGDTLKTKDELKLPGDVKVPPGTLRIEVSNIGSLIGKRLNDEVVITKAAAAQVGSGAEGPAQFQGTSTGAAMAPTLAWAIALGLCVVIYGLGRLIVPFQLPKPDGDVARPFNARETGLNLLRTLEVIGFVLAIVVALGNIRNLVGHGIATVMPSIPLIGPTSTWLLNAERMQWEFIWLFGMAVATGAAWLLMRTHVKGTEMSDAFTSFLRQDRIAAILAFVVFYRFGEAMVGRIAPLFLLDPQSKGGLALSTDQVGIINNTVGVIGIVLGGIVGGVVVSKIGLRKAFLPLALAMHVPNLMYLWAAYNQPALPVGANALQMVFSPISAILFVDQFGYGFGFAAYMVYLMWVAQRGTFKTAHYAIGTGLGALCIVSAGILSGIVQSQYGYIAFFWTVMVTAIPGMLTLLIIPLDEKQGRDIVVEEVAD